jgi:hypothetical protein
MATSVELWIEKTKPIGITAAAPVEASTPFAGALEPEVARVTELNLYEDGSGYLLYNNGTELHFYHNFMDPLCLYDNSTTTMMRMAGPAEPIIPKE